MKKFPCVDACFNCQRPYWREALRLIYCGHKCLLEKQAEIDATHREATVKGGEAMKRKAQAKP